MIKIKLLGDFTVIRLFLKRFRHRIVIVSFPFRPKLSQTVHRSHIDLFEWFWTKRSMSVMDGVEQFWTERWRKRFKKWTNHCLIYIESDIQCLELNRYSSRNGEFFNFSNFWKNRITWVTCWNIHFFLICYNFFPRKILEFSPFFLVRAVLASISVFCFFF